MLFEYVGLECTPLSKPFKTKKQAEKARGNIPNGSGGELGLVWSGFRRTEDMDSYSLITLVRVPESALARFSELSDHIGSIHGIRSEGNLSVVQDV